MSQTKPPATGAGLAWYRYPLVWLVIALPLSVVIASLYTFTLVQKMHDDAVVSPKPSDLQDPKLIPAQKARNQAQSGGLDPR